MYIIIQKGVANISIVLLGDDLAFLKRIKSGLQWDEARIHIPTRRMSKGEDMHFASSTCNSLVMTSRRPSTYGWWIAYLMRKGGTVFYNAQYLNFGDYKQHDMFPPHWIPLRMVNIQSIDYEVEYDE